MSCCHFAGEVCSDCATATVANLLERIAALETERDDARAEVKRLLRENAEVLDDVTRLRRGKLVEISDEQREMPDELRRMSGVARQPFKPPNVLAALKSERDAALDEVQRQRGALEDIDSGDPCMRARAAYRHCNCAAKVARAVLHPDPGGDS